MEFKVGDRVRMLRSPEEGIVIRIKDRLVEIETTEGFEIPVLPSELVLVSKSEDDYFRKTQNQAEPEIKKEFLRKEALYLAFEPLNDNDLRVWFVNETLRDMHMAFSVKKEGAYKNTFSSFVKSQSESRIHLTANRLNIENFSRLFLQVIRFREGEEFKPSEDIELNLKFNKILRETRLFGPNRRTGYVYEITPPAKVENSAKAVPASPYFSPVLLNQEKTIDLHAEKLGVTHLSAVEILNFQLETFQKEFDLGIANDLMELTVIHGVGNGTLRDMIHKFIAKNEHVEWFKDAHKEKFGYGATLIHYKA